MIVVGTGHRPKKLNNIYNLYHPFYLAIGRDIRRRLLNNIKSLKEDETLTVVCGMALGFDTLVALVVCKLKKEFPGKIRLHCEIPCKGHGAKWSNNDVERYNAILKTADVVDYTSELNYVDYRTMYKRDEKMVDLIGSEDGYVLALWNGVENGGTYHTISYAENKGKKVEKINYHQYVHLLKQTL